MQIGARIRDHRTQAGMSQDDLAMRVYVSRQTISSWENDKTYPDVQSLLLLSDLLPDRSALALQPPDRGITIGCRLAFCSG